MSNLWISAKTITGPQAVTAPAEPNSEQTIWALSSVNYQNTLVTSTVPAEPNSAQATWGITSLNYA